MILWGMHFIPGMRLRADEDSEIFGIDDSEMGEVAYDYVTTEVEINPIRGCGQEMSAMGSITSGM